MLIPNKRVFQIPVNYVIGSDAEKKMLVLCKSYKSRKKKNRLREKKIKDVEAELKNSGAS